MCVSSVAAHQRSHSASNVISARSPPLKSCRESSSPAVGGEPARASSSATAISRDENAPYNTGTYPITSATNPNPVPASSTISIRASEPAGCTSPSPSVKIVVPLTYRQLFICPHAVTGCTGSLNGMPSPKYTSAYASVSDSAHTTNSTSSAAGPYRLYICSRSFAGRSRPPSHTHGAHVSRKNTRVIRSRPTGRRGRIMV